MEYNSRIPVYLQPDKKMPLREREPRPGFSGALDLRRYERENRRRLLLGLAFGADALALLFLFCPPLLREPSRPREEPYRTIIADIIEIPPSLPDDEPVVIPPPDFSRRHPHPPAFMAGTPRVLSSPSLRKSPDAVAPSFEREIGPEAEEIAGRFSDSLNVDAGLPRGPDGRIPLRRDTGADPGAFESDIVYDLHNPAAAQGYVHIPLIRFAEPEMRQTELYVRSLRGLTAAINRRTNIIAVLDDPLSPLKMNHNNGPHFLQIMEAPVEHGISLGSLWEIRPPMVYFLLDRKPFLNRAEKKSLASYVEGGGFLIVESARPGNEQMRNELRGFLSEILVSAPVEPVPIDHQLFHCYYDFGDVPEGAGQSLGGIPFKVQPHLDGVWIKDRLAAIFSDRGYGLCWAAEGDYGEQEKMGVNLALYSLVREREQQSRMTEGRPGAH